MLHLMPLAAWGKCTISGTVTTPDSLPVDGAIVRLLNGKTTLAYTVSTDSGADERDYQLLLISRAARCRFPALANALSRSPIRDRIVMMQRDATKRAAWRLLFLLPGLLCAGFLLASPVVSTSLRELNNVTAVNKPQKAAGTPDVMIGGELIPMEDMEKVDPSQIESITVRKDLPDHPDGLIIVKMKE